jgi:predicted transcriptional regulator
MTLSEVQKILDAEVVAGCCWEDIDVVMGCGADLMSDVPAFAERGALLLTGLTNTQVIRTSMMAEIAAICFVRAKRPPKETVEMAVESDLPLLSTRLPMFEACGRLYGEGLRGCSEAGG